MITQRPNPTALASSVRMNAETLAKITAVKKSVRDALSDAQDFAATLGVSVWTREFAEECLTDILGDLFGQTESDLRDAIEIDAHLLERSGA